MCLIIIDNEFEFLSHINTPSLFLYATCDISLNIITGLRLARASSITWEYPSVNEGKIKML